MPSSDGIGNESKSVSKVSTTFVFRFVFRLATKNSVNGSAWRVIMQPTTQVALFVMAYAALKH